MPSRLAGPQLEVALAGSPNHIGTIVATTTKNNHDTATAFSNTGDALTGKVLLLQPDAACYVKTGATNGQTVTTANGVLLEANEKFPLSMPSGHGFIAALAVSGTANVKVFELV